jgi:L-asparaginase / beta-aspartyl-peptidase
MTSHLSEKTAPNFGKRLRVGTELKAVVELEAERASPPPSFDHFPSTFCRRQTVPINPISASSPFVQESGNFVAPVLLVHGGAGTFERLREEGARTRLEVGLATALAAGWGVLERGGGALLASVEAVASLEDSGLFNAGRGSARNSEGLIETDASVMDGSTKAAGAVCAASWPANPVRAALAVAGLADLDASTGGSAPRRAPNLGGPTLGQLGPGGGGWRPLLLAGAGADRLAKAAGLTSMTTSGHAVGRTGTRGEPTGESNQGTVGAVALDSEGHLAAATSTGGLAGKPPGRVGDSAIVGSGTWADDATVAVSATGVGEAFILAGFAHRVDWAVRSGAAVGSALSQALDAVSLYDGNGGAIALTPSGQFAAIFGTRAMARGWRGASELVVRI